MKNKEWCRILSQEEIGTDIYSMWLETPSIGAGARPGQFVSLYCRDKSRLLPRPISICEADAEKDTLRIVYRVVGAGTEEFSRLKEGDTVDILGVLGHGFPLDQVREDQTAFLMGGGIGIPPMLETAKAIQGEKLIVSGYRDELFLTEELNAAGELYLATEDGSAGTKGNVLDAVRANRLEADVIFACGPTPMLRAIKAYALEKGIPCWISMEERMACGIGACLACVCKSTEVDGHSLVHNKRICKDGPVFLSTEVEV